MVKKIHLPMQEAQETWMQSLGWEDSLEKEMATHPSILAWTIPWTEESGSPWGCIESDTTEWLSTHTQTHTPCLLSPSMLRPP